MAVFLLLQLDSDGKLAYAGHSTTDYDTWISNNIKIIIQRLNNKTHSFDPSQLKELVKLDFLPKSFYNFLKTTETSAICKRPKLLMNFIEDYKPVTIF